MAAVQSQRGYSFLPGREALRDLTKDARVFPNLARILEDAGSTKVLTPRTPREQLYVRCLQQAADKLLHQEEELLRAAVAGPSSSVGEDAVVKPAAGPASGLSQFESSVTDAVLDRPKSSVVDAEQPRLPSSLVNVAANRLVDAAAGSLQEKTIIQRKAELDAERVHGEQERTALMEKMRAKQLEIAAAAVTDRLQLLQKNRLAQRRALGVQRWSEADQRRAERAKELCTRRARWLAPKTVEQLAGEVRQLKNGLRLARQRLRVDANQSGSSIQEIGQALTKEFMSGMDLVSERSRSLDSLLRGLSNEHCGLNLQEGDSDVAPSLTAEMHTDRATAEKARREAAQRLYDAESKLDALNGPDISADIAERFKGQVQSARGETRQREHDYRRVNAMITQELMAHREKDEKLARAALVHREALQAQDAKEAEQRLAAEHEEKARKASALREAEQQRLVPVKIKIPGLRKAHIADIDQFEQVFKEKMCASLQLDESQLRLLRITGGTG